MKRSPHNLSHTKLLSCSMGECVPIACVDVLPGDTVQHATSLLLRAAPLLAPVMHPVHARVHHFFVPFRLLWDNGKDDSWEAFITGGHDGLDASVFPTITFNNISQGSLADYFGVTPGVASDRAISAMPFRGYSMIWNEYFRDQNLQTELTIDTTGGTDTTTNTTLQNVCWEKDYFTSARPWTQLGAEVSLPLGTEAPVQADGNFKLQNAAGTVNRNLRFTNATTDVTWDSDPGVTDGTKYESGLKTNLSAATAATINELREAWAIQRYEEARARYGARYTEYLRYLGVRPSDARLQRPEYLGGGKATIQFSEVLQQGVTTSGTPNTGVGSLLGHGIGAVRSNRYRRFFEEHGMVISLLSVLPKTMYVNGTPRSLIKTTKEDYWQKELQHIGQQEVYNREVYAAHTTPAGVFGYQDRYDEYRRCESSVHADFRDTTLNYWHLGRAFSSDPSLNSSFVGANPSTRIFQSASADTLYVMAYHSMQARRMVAKVGSPGGI